MMGTYLGEFIGFVRDDTIYRNREEHVTNIYPRGWQNPYPSTGETVLEAYWRTLHLDKLPSNLAGKLGPRYMSGRRLLRLLRGTMAAAPILMAASTVLALWCAVLDQLSHVVPQLIGGGGRGHMMHF